MKYVEELNLGDTFNYQNNLYLLTSDSKSNGDRLCYSLTTGCAKWLNNQTIIEVCPVYTLDTNNNIIPTKIAHK